MLHDEKRRGGGAERRQAQLPHGAQHGDGGHGTLLGQGYRENFVERVRRRCSVRDTSSRTLRLTRSRTCSTGSALPSRWMTNVPTNSAAVSSVIDSPCTVNSSHSGSAIPLLAFLLAAAKKRARSRAG